MPILVLILQLAAAQDVLGPVTPCPVIVDVVDPGWMPLPGVDVTVRDERTRTIQSARTSEGGIARFTVQSCADDRCRFTISAALTGFKTVTLKRLWFGQHQNEGTDRHVQLRLTKMTGPKIVVYSRRAVSCYP